MAKQPMIGYHLDEENHWVAELKCGHFQHVRHDPPWTTRPWVLTEQGRWSGVGLPGLCPYRSDDDMAAQSVDAFAPDSW